MSDTPECPVCAGSGFVNILARVSPTDEYACWCCDTVFTASGAIVGSINPEWRVSSDDLRQYGAP